MDSGGPGYPLPHTYNKGLTNKTTKPRPCQCIYVLTCTYNSMPTGVGMCRPICILRHALLRTRWVLTQLCVY